LSVDCCYIKVKHVEHDSHISFSVEEFLKKQRINTLCFSRLHLF